MIERNSARRIVERRRFRTRLETAGRTAFRVTVLLLVLASAVAAWVGVRGALAYQHLNRIQTAASESPAAFAESPASAVTVLEGLATDARAAKDLTSDVLWALAEQTPWIGPQLAAFRTVAASSDQLLSEGLLPLAKVAHRVPLKQLTPANGRIESAVFDEFKEPVRAAASASRQAASAVQDIDRTPLIRSVSTAVDRADEVFEQSASALDALSRATQIVPSLLGAEGPRSLLVLVQNNAEWRSLGGISGTAILMRTDDGAVSLVDTRSATELTRGIRGPAVQLADDVQQIYGTRPARYFHNLTEIPDFAVDGSLAREMYLQQTGVSVDGVIAIDPVALSYLLDATGPVSLPDGAQLTSHNAVSLLLSDVYARYPQAAAQDAFFAQASAATFSALLDGRGSTPDLLTAMSRAIDERRMLIWSTRPDEQAALDDTNLAGRLPVTDSETARFGVYLNDGTGSKMSYYVNPSVNLTWDSCKSDTRALTLTMRLDNAAPADAATSLPPYVTGNGAFGTPPGSATVVSNIYLPQGWSLTSATTTSNTGYTTATYEGREVLTFGSTLAPQSADTVSITVQSISGASEAEALVTPTADADLSPTVRARCAPSSTATLQ